MLFVVKRVAISYSFPSGAMSEYKSDLRSQPSIVSLDSSPRTSPTHGELSRRLNRTNSSAQIATSIVTSSSGHDDKIFHDPRHRRWEQRRNRISKWIQLGRSWSQRALSSNSELGRTPPSLLSEFLPKDETRLRRLLFSIQFRGNEYAHCVKTSSSFSRKNIQAWPRVRCDNGARKHIPHKQSLPSHVY